MTTHKEALTLALEMVQNKMYAHAEMYLKEALAQEQEPVAHTAVFHCPNCEYPHHQVTHITGVAQPPWLPQRKEQKPVAWMNAKRDMTYTHGPYNKNDIPLYTTPPQRTWVGLTEEEIEACFHYVDEAGIGLFDFAEAIEAKLKEKNT